jgi:hypothetical protein
MPHLGALAGCGVLAVDTGLRVGQQQTEALG